MAVDYEEEDLLDEFPFCLATDEELEKTIKEYITEIHLRVIKRDFKGIESLGQTLEELEADRNIKRRNRH